MAKKPVLPIRARPWRHGDAGLIVYFRLTPNSSKDAVNGLVACASGPAFKARVRAPPEDGAANQALERLVSEFLDVPKRSVSLLLGATSRLKALAITGEISLLEKRLESMVLKFNG